jgi:hypothetical protein
VGKVYNIVSSAVGGAKSLLKLFGNPRTDQVTKASADIIATEVVALNATAALLGARVALPTNPDDWQRMTKEDARARVLQAAQTIQAQHANFIGEMNNAKSHDAAVVKAASRAGKYSEMLDSMATNLNAKTNPTVSSENQAVAAVEASGETGRIVSFLSAMTQQPDLALCSEDDRATMHTCYEVVPGLTSEGAATADITADAFGREMAASFAAAADLSAYFAVLRGLENEPDLSQSSFAISMARTLTSFRNNGIATLGMVPYMRRDTECYIGTPSLSTNDVDLTWNAPYAVFVPAPHPVTRTHGTEVSRSMNFCINVDVMGFTETAGAELTGIYAPTVVVMLVEYRVDESSFMGRSKAQTNWTGRPISVHTVATRLASSSTVDMSLSRAWKATAATFSGAFAATVNTPTDSTVVGYAFIDPSYSYATNRDPWPRPTTAIGNTSARISFGEVQPFDTVHLTVPSSGDILSVPKFLNKPTMVTTWEQRRALGGTGPLSAMRLSDEGKVREFATVDGPLTDYSGQFTISGQALVPSEGVVRAPINLGTIHQYIAHVMPPRPYWERFVRAYAKASNIRLTEDALDFALNIPIITGAGSASDTINTLIEFVASTPGYRSL